MTTVHLEWLTEDERLRGMRVPVAVRTATLALYEQAEAPGTVELAPGTYVITAKMPAGQELTRVVKVGDEAVRVELTPEESPLRAALEYLASPQERRAVVRAAVAGAQRARARLADEMMAEKQAVIDVRDLAARGRAAVGRLLGSLRPSGGDPARFPRASEMLAGARPGSESPPGWLRGFAADPLNGTSRPVDLPLELVEHGDDVVIFRASPAADLRYVQSLQPGRPAVNIALPTSPAAGCHIVVRREPDRYWMEVHLQDPKGNLLLGYRRNAAPSEEALTAERLLADKLDDPIAAALGAYSLLRLGDLERLHDWPANLRIWFPWLPDGAAIHGEQLARRGDHDAALPAFLEAAGRGLPVFSDGIDFLYRRLELYGATREGFPAADLARADSVVARLHPLVGVINFSQAVTTLNGLDPARPDNTPFTGWPPESALDFAAVFR